MKLSRRQRHTDLVKACLAWLKLNHIAAWQNNTGAARFRDKTTGKDRVVRYGFKGSSDIIGILSGGAFLAVECKVGYDPLTTEQRLFLDAINEAGGCAIVVKSIEDLERQLAE